MSQISNGTTGPYDPFKLVRISRPNFTVHFRQPADMAGRYGFDYPRDADRYPIERIDKDSKGKSIKSRKRLYLGSIGSFNNIYLKDSITSNNLNQYDYLPAWLTIFPHTTNQVYRGGSDMHSQGVRLDIEVQQLINSTSSLSNSKLTHLEFVSSNPNKLTITPAEIPLADIINKGYKTTLLDSSKKKRNDYLASRAVLVKGVRNKVLTKHESISVYAVSKAKKYLVGELMVHKNNVTYKADLVFVDVTSTSNSSINSAADIEHYLKFKSFNQALIRAEKVAYTTFKLHLLNNIKVKRFLSIYRAGVSGIQQKYPKLSAESARNKFLQIIEKDFIDIYENYGNHNPTINGKKVKLNSQSNRKTFIFNTDLSAGTINGFAPGSIIGGKFKWGNIIIIFKQANTNNDTLVHEIGHSLTLRHIFDSKAQHVFYQGFSDKVMDYTWRIGSTTRNRNKRVSFTRYQWSKMQKDISIYKI